MVTFEQIRRADQLRGPGRFHETPLQFPTTLNKRLGANDRLHLKLELFQRTGSFKARGAASKIFSLTDQERAHGIIAASAAITRRAWRSPRGRSARGRASSCRSTRR